MTSSPRLLEAMLEVGRAVAEVAGMEELLRLIVERAAAVGDASRAAIAFVREPGDVLTMRAWVGLGDDEAEQYRGQLGVGLLGRAAQDQQPRELETIAEAEREPFLTEPHALALPLMAERRPKGVLVLCRATPFEAEQLQPLAAFAAHGAAAIDNVWLYDRYRELNAELEAKVEARTQELKQAQIQLYQHEKLASLGQLTAGIAHEINNPLAFVSSNLDIIEGKLQRLERMQDIERYANGCVGPALRILKILDGWKDHDRFPEDVASFFAMLPDDPEGQLAEAAAFMKWVRDKDEAEEGSVWQTVGIMRRFIGKTREGVERITTIVRDLRSFSRLDEATFAAVELHAGLEQTLSLLGHLFRGTDLELERDYQLAVPVPCHPARLNQVFMNLIVNAVQAQGGKGTVRIVTRQEGDRAVVEVLDQGPGVPAELRDRIFEPFFTTKPVGEGTGLGLSLSYGIVSDHGGTLEVDGAPGGGACFRVVLPLTRPPKQEQPS